MPNRLRHFSLALLATSVAACVVPLTNRTDGPSLGRKRVAMKLDPDTLVAQDGTRCTPSADKYARTAAGSDAWCTWVQVPGAHGFGEPSPSRP